MTSALRIPSRGSIAACLLCVAASASAAGDVVISQIYGGGGNSGAPLANDYVELFNRSTAPVSIAGWSVQYTSATGTGSFSQQPMASLTGILQPGQYFLVQLAPGTSGGAPLPAFDASANINMAAGAGKVVLVNTNAGLACNGSTTPCTAAQLAQIVDLVGYGNANFFETAAAPTLSAANAGFRAAQGCTDSDSNAADFSTGSPAPRNRLSPLNPCGTLNQPVLASCPATFAVITGVGGSVHVSASDADGMVISAAITSTPVAGISLLDVVPGTTLDAMLDVAPSTAPGNYPVNIQFANSRSDAADSHLHGGGERRESHRHRAHPRHPGYGAHLAAQRAVGVAGAGHRHRGAQQRLQSPGSDS